MALTVENDLNQAAMAPAPLIAVLLLAALTGLPLRASSLTSVRPLLLQCFRTAHDPSCQQALLLTEMLQRRAGAQDRYPCQTLLLGLQAEVVMAQLAVARGEKAFETLRESEQLCSGL